MKKKFVVNYASGGAPVLGAGNKTIEVNDEGIKVYLPLTNQKDFIAWDQVQRVDIESDVENKKISFSKAIGGGLLFGPVGAVLGGVSGAKKTHISLLVSYITASNERKTFVFTTNLQTANKAKSTIDEELVRRFGKAERSPKSDLNVPLSSDTERIEALSKLAELKE
jgi:hypothetical protein